MSQTATTASLSLARLLRLGIAMSTAGAGVIHLDAASDHSEHTLVAAFFVTAGIAQLVLAGLLCPPSVAPRTVVAALVVNGGMVITWVLSRTVGMDALPLVGSLPGMEGPEPVGLKDMAATSLEGSALLLGLLTLVLPASAAAAPLVAIAAQRGLTALAALTLAVTVPGLLAEHAHDHDDHLHTAGAHEHAEGHHDAGHDDGHADGHDHDGVHAHDAAQHVGHAGSTHEDHASHAGGHEGHEGHTGGGHPGHTGEGHDGHTGGGHTGHTGHTGDGHTGGGHQHDGHSGAPAETDPLAGPGQISTLRVGPYTIPGRLAGVQIPHTTPLLPMIAPGKLNLLPIMGIKAPCQDCYVLGMQPDLVYADGRDANLDSGPMLHHVVLIDPARKDPVCGEFRGLPGFLGERIFASGNERTGITLPKGYGMPFAGNRLNGAMELMNSSTQARTVYFELKVRWVPQTDSTIKPVRTVWMDIDSCADSEVNVDAGAHDIPWSWTSNVTGRFVGAGGHLHDGGTWLAMHNATRRQHICTSVAGYGSDPSYKGSLDHMSFCTWDRLGTVRSGDTLTLTAHYNAKTPQKGVMGIMLAFLYETPNLSGGSASPYPSEPPADGEPLGGHQH